MKKIPSISNQINEKKIFESINKNFSKLAPAYYTLITNWLSTERWKQTVPLEVMSINRNRAVQKRTIHS